MFWGTRCYVFLIVLSGMRFALMEAKVALARLLLEAELEPAPGHEELVLEGALGLLRSKDGVVVQVKAIKE